MFGSGRVSLEYPRLIFKEKVKVKHKENPFTSNKYVLDWSRLEEKKLRKFKDFCYKNGVDTEGDELTATGSAADRIYPGTAPKDTVGLTSKLEFVLSNRYLNQIKYNVLQAHYNYSFIDGGFDTMIREYCYKPSESHIQVAFFLLADCVFNNETEYFDRSFPTGLIASKLLCRFWSFQIGYGWLRQRCLVNELEEDLEYIDDKKTKSQVRNHIRSFDDWCYELDIVHQNILGGEDVEGPSSK